MQIKRTFVRNFNLKTMKPFVSCCRHAALVMSCASVLSCINKEYDFSNGIDTTVNVLKNVSVPVGEVESIKLGDILSLDEDSGFIYCESDPDSPVYGNYYLKFSLPAGDGFEQKLTIPAFSLSEYDDPNAHEAAFPSGLVYSPSIWPDDMWDSNGRLKASLELPKIVFDLSIDQTGLPEEIVALKEAVIHPDTYMQVSFDFDEDATPFHRIYVEKGATLTFPEWVVLGDAESFGFEKINEYTYKTIVDKVVEPHGSHYDFPIAKLDFTRFSENQGLVAPGHVKVDAHVEFHGKVFVYKTDCKDMMAQAPVVEARLHVDEIVIDEVSAKIDPKLNFSLEPIEIEGLPDFLTGDDFVVDLQDIRFDLKVDNSFCIGGNLETDIIATVGDERTPVHIGPLHIQKAEDEGSMVSSAYSLSEEGASAKDETYEAVSVAGLDNLLKKVPERIEIKDIAFDLDDDWALVHPGVEYGLSVDFGAVAPLAFGDEMRISFTQKIEGIGLALEGVQVKSLELSFDACSTIPIDFNMTAKALDADGNYIDGMLIELKDGIKGGYHLDGRQTVTHVSLKISNTADNLVLDALELTLQASAAGEHAGKALNMNQGLSLKNVVITLPEGIITDFGAVEE